MLSAEGIRLVQVPTRLSSPLTGGADAGDLPCAAAGADTSGVTGLMVLTVGDCVAPALVAGASWGTSGATAVVADGVAVPTDGVLAAGDATDPGVVDDGVEA